MIKIAFQIRWEFINCTWGSRLTVYGLHIKIKTPTCIHLNVTLTVGVILNTEYIEVK